MTKWAGVVLAVPLNNTFVMIKVQTWQISITSHVQANTTLLLI